MHTLSQNVFDKQIFSVIKDDRCHRFLAAPLRDHSLVYTQYTYGFVQYLYNIRDMRGHSQLKYEKLLEIVAQRKRKDEGSSGIRERHASATFYVIRVPIQKRNYRWRTYSACLYKIGYNNRDLRYKILRNQPDSYINLSGFQQAVSTRKSYHAIFPNHR